MTEAKCAAHEALDIHDPGVTQLTLGGRGRLYPGSEAQYWRAAYVNEPYFEVGRSFEDYGPAYELGWTGYAIYGGEFDTADRVLANDWIVQKGVSALSWDQARPACRAAWRRAHVASHPTDGSASPDQVRDTLGKLAQKARDGELGFMEAAAQTGTPSLSILFERRAQACRADAAELHECMLRWGGAVDDKVSGTVGGAAHRAWLQVRGVFGGTSDAMMLAECERGEGAALASYLEALQQNLPPNIHALVQRHCEAAQRNHDLVKTLLAQTRDRPEEDNAGLFGSQASGL